MYIRKQILTYAQDTLLAAAARPACAALYLLWLGLAWLGLAWFKLQHTQRFFAALHLPWSGLAWVQTVARVA